MSKAAELVKKAGKSKMSIDERKSVEQELRDLTEQLKKAEPQGEGNAPKPELLAQIPLLKARQRKLEDILNMDDDLVPKGPEKDALNKRRKEIEEVIKKEMPTARQQALRATGATGAATEFNKAVEQTIYHQKKHGKLIEEWQELMRRLNPDDPDADNTQNLL